MTEQENGSNEKSFKFWFILFGLLSIVLVAYYRGPSVASAHSIIAMMFVRQMSHIWKTNKDGLEQEAKILELDERLKRIEPYSD